MMAEYIDRQAAIDALCEQAKAMETWASRYDEQRRGILSAINIINDLPSADVQPVRHGHWRHYEGMLYCSVCSDEFYDDIMEYCGDDVPKHCPNCGALMDEGSSDDNHSGTI